MGFYFSTSLSQFPLHETLYVEGAVGLVLGKKDSLTYPCLSKCAYMYHLDLW